MWRSLLLLVSSLLPVKEELLERVVERHPSVVVALWPSPVATSLHTASVRQESRV